MKLLFCGSFRFIEDMKKLEEKLVSFGFECFLPRFSLGNFSADKIEEIKNKRKKKGLEKGELEKITNVTKWFFERIEECDAMIVFDKQGYIGLAAASEIGAAYILKKPVFFLEEPEDSSIKAMICFANNFKVMSLEKLIRELRLTNEYTVFDAIRDNRGKGIKAKDLAKILKETL